MTYEEAIQYIHSVNRTFCKPGLSRMQELCSALGNPQDRLRFLHVAGTNGKGSFCAMLSSVLEAAGYRTGRFTSPYVKSFCERIALGQQPIPKEMLASLVERIIPTVARMEDKPTEFELITALGFLYFAEEGCDLVVLECGLGGRLDATNLISTSCLSVITGIALDHTDYLGDTHAAIAKEKAGILRPETPVLWCGSHPDADAVIRAAAKDLSAPLTQVNHEQIQIRSADLTGTCFDFGAWKNIRIPLLGSYQPKNAANVLTAVELLRKSGIVIPDAAVRKGLENTVWHARFELLSKHPTVLADGGHNPEGVAAAVDSIRTYFGEQRVLIVSGLMADKNYREMADRIASIAAEVFCVTPQNPRSLPAEEYAKEYRERGVAATAFATVREAVSAALDAAEQTDRPILCLGSLYLYGEFCLALEEATKTR